MTECINWTGPTYNEGYGYTELGGRKRRAHRQAWIESRGPIPEGYVLHHECENKSCVNIEHLRLMTNSEHLRLHLNRRRKQMARPTLFTAEEIEETLQFQASRGLTPEQGAAEMGVSYATWAKYLTSCGGAIVTNRCIYMPNRKTNDEATGD